MLLLSILVMFIWPLLFISDVAKGLVVRESA